MRLLTVLVAAAATIGMVSAATAHDAAVTTLAMAPASKDSAGTFVPLANAHFSAAGLRTGHKNNFIEAGVLTIISVVAVTASVVAVTVADSNNNTTTTCHVGSASGAVTVCPAG